MEKAIAEATADWTRIAQRRQRPRLAPVPAPGSVTGRKLPPPPDWWKGDEEAMRSTLIAQQQLRQGGR